MAARRTGEGERVLRSGKWDRWRVEQERELRVPEWPGTGGDGEKRGCEIRRAL
jgi:hypothetical protein